MSEPVYEYVKGVGWVPTTKKVKYQVYFKEPEWDNYSPIGLAYEDYQSAVQRIQRGTERYRGKFIYKIKEIS